MSTTKIDLIVIAERAKFGRVREYCVFAGPQTLERFDRSSPAADFVVMKLSAAKRTCQLAWGQGIGGLLSAIKQLYEGSAEFRLLLAKDGEALPAVQQALTEMGASMIASGDEAIN